MSTVQRSSVGCCAGVDHVIDRIQRERNIVRHPENSIAAANNRLWSYGICNPDPGRKIVLLKREVVPYPRGHQVDIPVDDWRTWGKKLIQIARCAGHEIRQPVETLGPWPLQFITKPKTDG